jgi:hypothetical protein
MTDEQRVWIKDLRAGSDLEEVYAVRAADVRQRRGGGPYLAATLGDRTGEVKALVWQNIDRFRGVLEPGNVVAVKGQVQRYNQQLQIVVRQAEAVPEASVDEELFLRSSSVDPTLLWKRLMDTIEGVGDPDLRQLLLRVFSDSEVEERFRVAPAARSMHHAFRSGLLEHTVSVAEIARLLSGPSAIGALRSRYRPGHGGRPAARSGQDLGARNRGVDRVYRRWAVDRTPAYGDAFRREKDWRAGGFSQGNPAAVASHPALAPR